MPKVMLVEDDNNLREIYDARLVAEGYEIVSAHDGEEALALAVKERPDLIISDVMMPKISGFDMLDILRSTPETKNTKVIMMTALSQAEDRERADKLGADRYLVKSQVTLEDVIKVAHEILNDSGPAASAPPAANPVTATVTNDAPVAAPPAEPVVDTPAPAPAAEPTTVPVAEPPADTPTAAPTPTAEPSAAPAAPTTTVTDVGPLDSTTSTTTPSEPPTVTATPDAEPVKAEAAPAPEAPSAPLETPTASAPPVPEATSTTEPIADNLTQTKSEETDGVEKQIQDFVASNPTLTNAADSTTTATPEPTSTPAAPASSPTSIPVTTQEPEEPAATPQNGAVSQDELSNPTSSHSSSAPEPPSHRKLVLTPTDAAMTPAVDLNALLEKENANDAIQTPATSTVITPATEADGEQPTTTVSPNDISL